MLDSLDVLLKLKDVQIRAEALTFSVFFHTFNDAPGGSPEAKRQRNLGTRWTPNLTILRRLFFVVLRCFFVAFRVPAVKDNQNHIEFATLRRLFVLLCVACFFNAKHYTGLRSYFLTRIG